MNAPQDKAAQPWHPADEKPRGKHGNGAPIGTHSLTGSSANVGMPPKAKDAERGVPVDQPPGGPGVDPLAEPRAQGGDLLGRKD
jgi:hypothetical protein